MPKQKVTNLQYTETAKANAIAIKNYLHHEFTDREVESFLLLLRAFEKAISTFPELYPLSGKSKGVRRAVLNKYLSAYYIYDNQQVTIIAYIDNRNDLADKT
jgi:plasmid stabilization system protein ParE